MGRFATSTGMATVRGPGSAWIIADDFNLGNSGNGTLSVEAGAAVESASSNIGRFSTATGTATVTGAGSTWTNSDDLVVGDEGSGTLNIETGGLVTVGFTTTIGTQGTINLTGGTLQFGSMSLTDLARINGVSGTLRGTLEPITGFNSLSNLSLSNLAPAVSIDEVAMLNQGVLFGSGLTGLRLTNDAAGEVEAITGERMRFTGSGNTNAGVINNFGGQIRFTQDLTNETGGVIQGRGQFITSGGLTNAGQMNFSGGFADVVGDVTLASTGTVTTSGGGVTTFFDDVHFDAGSLVTTTQGSQTVAFGQVTGTINTDGDGLWIIANGGTLLPGNSPGLGTFGGDLTISEAAAVEIELAGLMRGTEHDALDILGALQLDGTLNVLLLDGFTPEAGSSFDIFNFGSLAGSFDAINLPTLTNGLEWDTSSLYLDGTLTVVTSLIVGDFDGSGAVGQGDLNLVLLNWGSTASPAGFDASALSTGGPFDGNMSQNELNDVLLNWGNTAEASGGSAVPEPATLALIAVGTPLLRRRRG